ncbi:hypothetical protein [Marinobacter sp. SS21]|uniref:hypothetical protein n=1 Tax=Marinobacter sp. SS21 TaxID=2979460 RepID=UPI0023303156|nr:hypothetical protein [Marinobacter sp. SS21]MDC0663830.1 hypothetical protein [Marinobacter sp. SS21]
MLTAPHYLIYRNHRLSLNRAHLRIGNRLQFGPDILCSSQAQGDKDRASYRIPGHGVDVSLIDSVYTGARNIRPPPSGLHGYTGGL